MVSAPAASADEHVPPYETIFDGTADSFADWAYAGRGGFNLNADGTITSRAGSTGGFGTLWYTPEQYGDFEMRVQFRDDGPDTRRANSGIQVRFPALNVITPGCTPVNGAGVPDYAWGGVQCGHEIQLNDSPDGDPRKTGSIYGFADLTSEQSRPTAKGTWNEMVIRVIGQHYTVIRNGVVINEFHNAPGIPFPGRPEDPGSSGRGLRGYVGLQAHGAAQDVMTFGDVEIRDLTGVSRTEAWFNGIDELLEGLVDDDRINSRVAANLTDRLERAEALASAGSETRTIGYLEQLLARANNQIRGDADDLQVREAVVSQVQALIDVLQELEDDESSD